MCNYCCRFIDDPEIEKKVHHTHLSIVPKFFGDVKPGVTTDHLQNLLLSGPKTYNELASIDEKNREMIAALVLKLQTQGEAVDAGLSSHHDPAVAR